MANRLLRQEPFRFGTSARRGAQYFSQVGGTGVSLRRGSLEQLEKMVENEKWDSSLLHEGVQGNSYLG